MPLQLSEAQKFTNEQTTVQTTAEASTIMTETAAQGKSLPKDEITPDEIQSGANQGSRAIGEFIKDGDKGKLGAGLIGAAGNFLPVNISKYLPIGQFALDGSWTKFLKGDGDTVKKGLELLTKFLPPKLAGLVGKAGPLLSTGLRNLLSGKGLGDMLSSDGLMGLASQFLPPWAGDTLEVGKKLASGDIAGAVDGLISKFIPPELKAAYDAIKNASGGLKGLIADLFDKPKLFESIPGPWAARITDAVVCPGGAGNIITGLETVKIGGQSAARINDTATCLPGGVPDLLDHGEPTVMFGGQWATRKGDFTKHIGAITTGFDTVHIGKAIANCDGCLIAGASGGGTAATAGAGAGAGGAATISGSGITSPFGGDSILGDIAAGVGNKLKDMGVDKIKSFAMDKVGDLMGADKDKVYDGSNFDKSSYHQIIKKDSPQKKEDKPKPQPNSFDDDDKKGGGIW